MILLKSLLRALSWLPLPLAHGLGSLLGTLAYRFPSESCHTTRINLRLCFPELSGSEIETLTKRSLVETARTACELGAIWLRSVPRALSHVTCISGHEVLTEALGKGKGVIVLAPHLGNWELCGLYLTTCAPATYLYKPPKLAGFEPAMINFRSRGGATLAPTNRKGVALLVKALQRGEIVGILPDQEPNAEGGVFAPFFGVDALTMTLVAKLAARTGAAVVTVFAQRLPEHRGFEIKMTSAGDGLDSEDLVQAATALNRAVETCVRQAPEQYQWEYKRFRRKPDRMGKSVYR